MIRCLSKPQREKFKFPRKSKLLLKAKTSTSVLATYFKRRDHPVD